MRWLLFTLAVALAAQDDAALWRLERAALRAELREDDRATEAALRQLLEASRRASDFSYSQAVGRLANYYLERGEERKGQKVLEAEFEATLRQGPKAFPRLAMMVGIAHRLQPVRNEDILKRIAALQPPPELPVNPQYSPAVAAVAYASVLEANGKPEAARAVWESLVAAATTANLRVTALIRVDEHLSRYGQADRTLDQRIRDAARLEDQAPTADTVFAWTQLTLYYFLKGRNQEREALQSKIQSAMQSVMAAERTRPQAPPTVTTTNPRVTAEDLQEAEELRKLQAEQQAASATANATARQEAKLATEHIRAKRFQEADEVLGRLLKLADEQPRASSIAYIELLSAANEFRMVKSADRTLSWTERVGAAAQRRWSPPAPQLTDIQERVAQAYREAGRTADAERIYREVLDVLTAAGANTSSAWKSLAQLKLEQCNCADAAAIFVRVIDDLQPRVGAVHPDLIGPLLDLAEARDRAGLAEGEAREPLDRAWAIARKLPVADIAQQDGQRGAVLAATALHWFVRRNPAQVDEVRKRAKELRMLAEFERQYSLILEFRGHHAESEKEGRLYDKAMLP